MKIYITGGTGFIGSYVVDMLAKAGHEVHVLARNVLKVPSLKTQANVTVHHAPVGDWVAMEKAIQTPDALIHVALGWGDTGPEMIKNETLTSVELIDLAIQKGAKKIIFTSSTAAVGYYNKLTDETAMRKPIDFYGATKGAVELFVNAYAHYFPEVALNIIRPGYTFGNPVFEGSDMQPDKRFREICTAAQNGKPIEVIKHDGTQFIWAGHLAEIYKQVIESDVKSEIFFGLAANFTTWEQVALWAVAYAQSSSEIKVIDKGWDADPILFKMQNIQKHFNLSFDSTAHLKEHIQYNINL